jgi:hypothetical protein
MEALELNGLKKMTSLNEENALSTPGIPSWHE